MVNIRTEMIPREEVLLPKAYPIYVAETVGVTVLYQKPHWHDVLEINLIKSGTGYYIINGQRFDFEKGDILLINSNDLHCAYENSDLIILVITFDASWFLSDLRYDPNILLPYTEMGRRFTNLLDRSHPSMDLLRMTLLDIQAEHQNKHASYVSVVRANLLRFLAYVNRYFQLDNEAIACYEKVGSFQLDKMRRIISILEKQFAYPWTIEELGELTYLSPSRFSAIFKNTVGTSPLEYLIQIRLENAAKLLETTDRKIVDIAHECGFRSLSNFNRLFKQRTGFSPREARRRLLAK
ncbi:AraC family transcriptional regulator [Paenibacillus tyrfis]|uniref:AraC family transcriptional regulator n=1 Tax=Paenibacillus tyrfis TaxID=1501230 RepID=UPI0020A0294D|nr:AraC family transcriptional regulator [Paenibacillus tyrfis]MCP1308051.1 AraC family transcriptional regulator [Paenibacillus tyrfis]